MPRVMLYSLAVSFVCLYGVLLSSFASLSGEVDSLLNTKSPPGTEWGILVERLEDGATVYQRRPDIRMIPASNMKIVSGAAALLGLGQDFRYETTLFQTGVHIDDTVTGSLIVVGTGDPSIGGRFNGGDITQLFREWANVLKQKKMTTITGDLVGVDHAFDSERYGLNWNPEDYVEWYAAEISALTLNDSCIDLIITGSTKPGNTAAIEPDPPTSYMNIINRVRTVSTRKQERMIEFIREPESRQLTIRGAVRKNKRIREYASVPNPTLFFLTILKETLENEGIQIRGAVRAAKRDSFPLKQDTWYELAKHLSPPFTQLLSVCLRNSQNLYAEHFLKTLGFRGFGKGSLSTGTLVMKDLLAMQGCTVLDNPYIGDGSGLSRDNRISPRALVEILHCMDKSKYANTFRQALPQSGVRGTLKHRMKDNAAYQNVFAKTGTLTGVRALSGYLIGASGKEYVFSMIANGTQKDDDYNDIMDEACAIIVKNG